MSVFIIDTYIIKIEKQSEFGQYLERFLEYRQENPVKFEECKSWKVFCQAFGSMSGAYVEMMEFNDMIETEKWGARMRKDEMMAKFREEFVRFMEPATHSMSMWVSVM